MQDYAYIHSSPFEQAQRYDFADCASTAFLEGWRLARRQAQEKFKIRAAAKPEKQEQKTALAIPESLPLATLIVQSKTDEFVLWKLLKKYEIYGKLYSHYRDDLTKHSSARPASMADYIAFAESLVLHAQREQCLQYLSTLLKLIDAICGYPPDNVTPADAARITDLFESEAALVKIIEQGLPS